MKPYLHQSISKLIRRSQSQTTYLFILLILFTILSSHAQLTYAVDTSYITPTYIKTISSPYEEYNDINPSWSTNGKYISYERYDMRTHKIILSNKSGKQIQTIISQTKKEPELDLLFSTEEQPTSYNTGISWSSQHDEFVFVSSGKSNNLDLFIGKVGTEKTRRLTSHAQADNQAKWSPTNDNIVFISAREDHASLYMINAKTGTSRKLLDKKYDALHPVWSPDGKKIALMIRKSGEYQIYVINDLSNPENSLTLISQSSHHNIRPSWSPDGQHIAYFSFGDDNNWNINISDFSKPEKGESKETTIAYNVIQNSSEGPTWLPNSNNIAYIKNERNTYNPIYIVNRNSKKHSLFLTNTAMNFDLSCSKDGILAFQSQNRQWTRIYIAGLPGFNG